MKPLNVLRLYGVRLRARWLHESCAVAGIAAGVALLFASQVASSSLHSSVARLSREIAGRATLQLRARDPHGFPEGTLRRVRQLPGVRVAAPIVEAGANAVGPRGARAVELIGADQSLPTLGGTLLRGGAPRPFAGIGAVVLPASVSSAIGVTRFGGEVDLQLAGHTAEAPLYTQPGVRLPSSAGDVAVVPLSSAQQMLGLRERVSRILVEPEPGASGRVASGLRALARGRVDVEAVSHEARVFATAAAASNQSTALFSAVSALVGFLFAFNAMLLTVPQRRRLVVDLCRDGYEPRTVIGVLLLDVAALGAVACALGLALGEELSIHVLHSNPTFLSLAFAVGSGRTVTWQSVAIAVGGGMLAATVAVLSPLRDIVSRDPLAAGSRREGPGTRLATGRAALAGAVCLAAATAVLAAAPDAAVPGIVLLVGALLLELPLALELALAVLTRLARTTTGLVAHAAAMELRAAGARATAIAATGAVAIFGSVAIQGAHADLLAGLERAARETSASADVWVSPAGSYDLMDTTPFAPVDRRTIERVRGVGAVSLYRGGLLDYGARRALVLAPSSRTSPLLADEVVKGDAAVAARRLRAGGWLVVSQALAAERHLRVGEAFVLPSPNPTRFRVAALSTNLGWAPGAIVMNAADYARAWGSDDASAYAVRLAHGASAAAVVGRIDRALGPHSGLAVQTAAARTVRQSALSRRALAQLAQIAVLVPIVAVLAMAAAIGAMVWQRRPRLAKLRLEGISRAALWRTILLESLLLVGVGGATGAVFGLYGQQLADRALADTINFPVVHSITPLPALTSLAAIAVAALAILAVPGYRAASAPVALAMHE